MLTVRQLRYFEALAETLHFGRAAERLNVSQPALSAQIGQMEETLGTQLFERRPAGAVLTADGRIVLVRVRRILTDLRDLEGLAGASGNILSGRLRLGIIATVAPYLLPELLPRFAENHPALDCEVRENITDVLIRDLLAGELDCAVVALPVDEPSLQTIRIATDRFCLAVPAGERARFKGSVPVSALKDERLILLEEGHCLRDQALNVCQLVEARSFASLGATSLATLLRMVAGGLGATLIPEIAVAAEQRGGGIEIVPFEAPAPERVLALAFRASSLRRRDFEALAELLALSAAAVVDGAELSVTSEGVSPPNAPKLPIPPKAKGEGRRRRSAS